MSTSPSLFAQTGCIQQDACTQAQTVPLALSAAVACCCCALRLQELLEFDCMVHGQSPRLFWTYKDESWGGLVASMAERRGGAKSAAAIGLTVMQRYRAWVNE